MTERFLAGKFLLKSCLKDIKSFLVLSLSHFHQCPDEREKDSFSHSNPSNLAQGSQLLNMCLLKNPS